MTQTSIPLPAPGYPMVTRVISSALFPEAPVDRAGNPIAGAPLKEEPMTWVLGSAHPLVPGMKIVRMFVVRASGGGVEIYSVTEDGRGTTRNLLPMHRVRFVEEVMPIDVFVEELELAEAGGEDDPDPDEPADPQPTGFPVDPGSEPPADAPIAP
jgi:hypothetical protein